jgi:subtilisin family serine protease
MSFGFPYLNQNLDRIHTAINEAFVSRVLMFAAAKNDGANSGIAYPANQDQVICVNSTDGHGNPSKYNPSPIMGQNLSVLGEDVLSSWPVKFKLGMQRKSGTSYATPIAAGIAAIVLEYALEKLPNEESYAIKKLRTPRGMQAVLGLMSEDRWGYRYLAPWTLFNEDRSNIYGAILDTLKKV